MNEEQETLEKQMDGASLSALGLDNSQKDADVSLAITDAFHLLLSSKSLYQNVTLSLEQTAPADDTRDTYRQRPWKPVSRNTGDTTEERAFWANANAGADPLETPPQQRTLSFYLPQIETFCSTCDKMTAFSSMPSSKADPFGTGLPQMASDTLQILDLHYRCGLCPKQRLFFMVKRYGLKLQLCGRSERLRRAVDSAIPKKYREIIEDALSAKHENDLPAAFYHIRTFIEHYAKDTLAMPVTSQITGDELCAQYNKQLDSRMTGSLPSLAVLHSTTSAFLHTRTGSDEAFDTALANIVDHIKAKALFAKYKIDG